MKWAADVRCTPGGTLPARTDGVPDAVGFDPIIGLPPSDFRDENFERCGVPQFLKGETTGVRQVKRPDFRG
ncbi:MAG: hypothetical protein KAY46_13560 [Burkholderiaceae bacterium]|nr:hypothetical protein [Burkholderiaceae bacterium]